MTLTVKEKEHWNARFSRTMDRVAEKFLASKDPTLMDDIKREARVKALESLGIAELQQELARVDDESAELDKRRRGVQIEIVALIRGVKVTEVSSFRYSDYQEVETAINRRKSKIEKELFENTEIGQRLLSLDEKKDELLDSVWMATSPKQIKELWATVSEVVEQLFASTNTERERTESLTATGRDHLNGPTHFGRTDR